MLVPTLGTTSLDRGEFAEDDARVRPNDMNISRPYRSCGVQTVRRKSLARPRRSIGIQTEVEDEDEEMPDEHSLPPGAFGPRTTEAWRRQHWVPGAGYAR